MKKALFFLISFVPALFFLPSFSQTANSAEYWWCRSCGLAYPLSQKFCLNKDCSLYRKPK